MGKRYKIAPEVRADIIRRIKEEGISVAQAAKDHGISDAAIYGWLGKGTKGSPSWSEFSRLKKERDQLLKLVGELTVRNSTAQKKSW
jgi:transposase-like protein